MEGKINRRHSQEVHEEVVRPKAQEVEDLSARPDAGQTSSDVALDVADELPLQDGHGLGGVVENGQISDPADVGRDAGQVDEVPSEHVADEIDGHGYKRSGRYRLERRGEPSS